MYLLAVKLDDFANDWDPYDYADMFSARTEGIENFIVGLTKNVGQILDWLTDVIDECEQWDDPEHDKYANKASKLIKEVTAWTLKI